MWASVGSNSGIGRNWLFIEFRNRKVLLLYWIPESKRIASLLNSGIPGSDCAAESIPWDSGMETNSSLNEFRNCGNLFRCGINSRNVQHCGIQCILFIVLMLRIYHQAVSCFIDKKRHRKQQMNFIDYQTFFFTIWVTHVEYHLHHFSSLSIRFCTIRLIHLMKNKMIENRRRKSIENTIVPNSLIILRFKSLTNIHWFQNIFL